MSLSSRENLKEYKKEYREEKISVYDEYKTGTYTYNHLDIDYMKIVYQRMILMHLCEEQVEKYGFPLMAYNNLLKKSKDVFTKMRKLKNPITIKIKGEASQEEKNNEIENEFKKCKEYIVKIEDFLKINTVSLAEVNNLVCYFQYDIVFNFLLGINEPKEQDLKKELASIKLEIGKESYDNLMDKLKDKPLDIPQFQKYLVFEILKKELGNIKSEIEKKDYKHLIDRLNKAIHLDANTFKMDAFFIWQIIHFPKQILQVKGKYNEDFGKVLQTIHDENEARGHVIRELSAQFPKLTKKIQKLNIILERLIQSEWNQWDFIMNPWDVKAIKEKYNEQAKTFQIALEKIEKKIAKWKRKALEKNKQFDSKEPGSPISLNLSSLSDRSNSSDSLSHSSLEVLTPSSPSRSIEDSPSSLRASSLFSIKQDMPAIPEVPETPELIDSLKKKRSEG